jgi:hypothetical protein
MDELVNAEGDMTALPAGLPCRGSLKSITYQVQRLPGTA